MPPVLRQGSQKIRQGRMAEDSLEGVAQLEHCTLRTAPRTVHMIRCEVEVLPGWIETWCGRRSKPFAPTWSAYLTCRKCERAHQEAQE